MESKDIFEKQYRDKKLVYKESLPWLRKMLSGHLATRDQVVKRYLEGKKGGKILDFGCGNGRLLMDLNGRFDQYIGVDISEYRIKEAKSELSARLQSESSKFIFKVVEPGSALDYDDRYFDVVTCIAVLPWIYDVYSLMKEFNRIIAPSGILIVETPNFAYFKRRLKLLFGGLPTATPSDISTWPDIGWDAGCIHYFTRKSLDTLFRQTGFNVNRVMHTGFAAKVIRIFPGLFAAGWVIAATKR